MKRFILALTFVLVGISAGAQTTLKVQWDQNTASEGVTSYNLYVDALPVVSVPNVLTGSCGCVQALTVFATGMHTVKVAAVAFLVSTDPASSTEGPAMTITFTLNPGSQIKNITVKR